MLIRYIIGRPTAPVVPLVLKTGKVSTNMRADTTADLYQEVCEREGQPVKEDYLEHLKQRDLEAWVYRYDMWADNELINGALYDAQHYQKAIAQSTDLPPKNGFACEMCHWRTYCETDPMALNADNWLNTERGKDPTPIKVRYGRTYKELSRARRGFVVSPSELRSFGKCQRLWAIEYGWRLRQMKEGAKSVPRIRGSLTHHVLDMLANKPDLTTHDLRVELGVLVLEMFNSQQIDPVAYDELIDHNGLDEIAKRAVSMFGLAMEGVAEVLEVEKRRVMRMPGSKKWLQGIPDMVVRLDNGQTAIIEYKTTSRTKNLPALADKYRTNPAVHLYAALVRHGQNTF